MSKANNNAEIPDYDSDDDQKPAVNQGANKKDLGGNLSGWNELFLK